jgi:hypothetical protein
MPLYGEPFVRPCPLCGRPVEAARDTEIDVAYMQHMWSDCTHTYPWED